MDVAAGLLREIRHDRRRPADRALLSAARRVAASRARDNRKLSGAAGGGGWPAQLWRWPLSCWRSLPTVRSGRQKPFCPGCPPGIRPALLARALKVYTTYAQRHDSLAGVRDLLPAGTGVVGFVAGADDADISLWRPIGGRHVEHFMLTDPPAQIRRQVEYAVVGGFNLKMRHTTIEDWLQQSGAELVASTNATLKVSEGPQPWFVVRFK